MVVRGDAHALESILTDRSFELFDGSINTVWWNVGEPDDAPGIAPLEHPQLAIEDPCRRQSHPFAPYGRGQDSGLNPRLIHLGKLTLDVGQIVTVDRHLAHASTIDVKAVAVRPDAEIRREIGREIVENRGRNVVMVGVDNRRKHGGAFATRGGFPGWQCKR